MWASLFEAASATAAAASAIMHNKDLNRRQVCRYLLRTMWFRCKRASVRTARAAVRSVSSAVAFVSRRNASPPADPDAEVVAQHVCIPWPTDGEMIACIPPWPTDGEIIVMSTMAAQSSQ